MSGWQCFKPPAQDRSEAILEHHHKVGRALMYASLTDRERRRCAALKGWRTRRAKERENA